MALTIEKDYQHPKWLKSTIIVKTEKKILVLSICLKGSNKQMKGDSFFLDKCYKFNRM